MDCNRALRGWSVRLSCGRATRDLQDGWPMRNIFRNNLRLKPSILTAFCFLTVPVFFTIIAVTYFSNDNIARANAKELVERFRIDALENIQDDFNPLKSLIRSAADARRPVSRLLLRQPLPEVLLQHPAAQPEDRQRLCRPERRLLSADAADRSRRRDPGQAAAAEAPKYAYRWIVPKAGSADPRSLCLPRCQPEGTRQHRAAPRPTIRAPRLVVSRRRAGAARPSSPIPTSSPRRP